MSDLYKAIYDFIPDQDGEIEIADGDICELIADEGDGWFNVKNQRTGETGFAPKDYFEVYDQRSALQSDTKTITPVGEIPVEDNFEQFTLDDISSVTENSLNASAQSSNRDSDIPLGAEHNTFAP